MGLVFTVILIAGIGGVIKDITKIGGRRYR